MAHISTGQEIHSIESAIQVDPWSFKVGIGGVSRIEFHTLEWRESGDQFSKPFCVVFDVQGNRIAQLLAETTNVFFKPVKQQ